MLAVVGTYQNGYVQLDKEYPTDKPVKVIVTFLEQVQASNKKVLAFSDFSFAKSQKTLEHYKGSFSETLVEERRTEL